MKFTDENGEEKHPAPFPSMLAIYNEKGEGESEEMAKEKYWKNGSGCYDPTAAESIENITKEEKARNKEVYDVIQQVKNILRDKDLVLLERIKVKDKRTKREYI